MVNKAHVSLADLTREIRKEKGLLESSEEDFARLIRSKYDYLLNNVIMRSKLDFRFKGKNMIPLRDKSIVKALLILASGYGSNTDKDSIFVDWFNGRIQEDEYIQIFKLGIQVADLISEEICYDDWDIDNVTRDEWIAAIHSAIKFDLATNILKTADAMQKMHSQLSLLNHGIPFGDLIKENEYGARVYQWKGITPMIDLSKPLSDSLKSCFSLDDYSWILQQFISLIQKDAYYKSIEFIMAYAEMKKATGYNRADQLLPKDSLASEYIAFFQNIYEYLYERPDLTEWIEGKTGTHNLLSFFKMKNRN